MKQFVLKIDEWSNLFWKLMNILITYRLDWGRTTTMKITSMHLVLIYNHKIWFYSAKKTTCDKFHNRRVPNIERTVILVYLLFSIADRPFTHFVHLAIIILFLITYIKISIIISPEIDMYPWCFSKALFANS